MVKVILSILSTNKGICTMYWSQDDERFHTDIELQSLFRLVQINTNVILKPCIPLWNDFFGWGEEC